MTAGFMRIGRSILFTTVLIASAGTYAASSASAFAGAIPEITITTVDHGFSAPAEVKAGLTRVTIQNDGHAPHHAQLARLKDGVTLDKIFAAMQEDPMSIVPMLAWVGGPSVVDHGGSSTVTLQLEAGTHMLLCFVPDEEGLPHLAHGMMGTMEVLPAHGEERAQPAADLSLRFLDFAYAFSEAIPSGPQTWEIVNDGEVMHEITLVRLNDGATMEDVAHFIHAPQGPPPFASVGGMQAMDPGATAWLHLDLTPGDYLGICHIPDMPSGQTHADLGMIIPFTVE